MIGWKAALRTDHLARLEMSDLHAGPEDPFIDAARTFDATNPTHWLT